MKTIIATAIVTAVSIVATSIALAAAAAAPEPDPAFLVGLITGIALWLWLSYRWWKGSITMGKENGFILVVFYWVLLCPFQMIHAIWIGTRPVRGEETPPTQNITINNVIREPRTAVDYSDVMEEYTEGASGIVAKPPK